MDAKIVKLEEIQKKYDDISNELMKDETVSDVKKYTRLSKEQAKLKAPYDAYQNYKKYNQIIEDGQEMLKDSDPEIREMAQMEIDDAQEKLDALNKHIEDLLLPRDPEDSNDCLVEIRGAAGGDEGNIFAGDLFRMYSYYADSLGYKIEVMESSESEAGGYTLISFMVKGLDAPAISNLNQVPTVCSVFLRPKLREESTLLLQLSSSFRILKKKTSRSLIQILRSRRTELPEPVASI